jgi:hypothetical protein
MNSASVQPFTECNGPGGCGPTLRGKSAKIQTQNWVSNCVHHILPPFVLCVGCRKSIQSLSIETGLQPKRIRDGREPEKEFLDMNFTKDRVFCSMVDFKENQTLLVLKIHIKKSKQENFSLFARVASCRKEK